MKEFIDYVLQFGNLNQQQIDLILKKAAEIELRKDDYYLEAGKVSRQFGFITEGIARVSYYNNKGEEITKYFIDELNIVVDLESFNNEIPSIAYVQAITDCKITVFSKKDWQELLNTIVGWDAIVLKIVSKALLQKVERISSIVAQDATTSYLTFLEKYPNLANRIPLSYLASYLGITQSSLSRIRKNLQGQKPTSRMLMDDDSSLMVEHAVNIDPSTIRPSKKAFMDDGSKVMVEHY